MRANAPPCFAAADDRGQSCPHLEKEVANWQCVDQEVESCTETKSVDDATAGVIVGKKGMAQPVLRAL